MNHDSYCAVFTSRKSNKCSCTLKERIVKKPLTDAQQRLIQLDLKEAEIKAYYEELRVVLAEVQAEVGENGMFQADDGTVYKVVKPKGTFVSFKDVDYVRTKREGEDRGSLSVKEASAAGYTVK
jgi:hypothetical protein